MKREKILKKPTIPGLQWLREDIGNIQKLLIKKDILNTLQTKF